MKGSKLTLYIFIALVIGIFTGWLFPSFAIKMQPLADVFLKMIKMIIAPLLFSTLVIGIAGHGDMKSLGKLGFKTIVYFEIVTTLALIIGLFFGNVFKPGAGLNIDVANISMMGVDKLRAVHVDHSIGHIISDIVPTSIVKSMAEGNLIQIVVFALFFAIAMCAIGQKSKPVMDVLQSLSEIMFKFTGYVMLFAPLGVFGAIAATIGHNGIGMLLSYAKIIGVLYLALFAFVAVVLIVVCKIAKIPVRGLLKAIKDPALLAFTTASSEAALPKAMEVMEKFGVPKNIVSFVMPTGYSFNLDGSTLYLALTTLFCVQIAGIHLSLAQQVLIMLTLMLTSKGVAGVPRVSLVVLTGTLVSFNYPLVGVAILLGIDQVLDMGRTTVNVIGNCVASAVVARWENVFDYEKMYDFLGIQKYKNGQPTVLSITNRKKQKREENQTLAHEAIDTHH